VSGTLIRSGFSSDDGTERLPLALEGFAARRVPSRRNCAAFRFTKTDLQPFKITSYLETASGSVKRADAMECIVSGWEPQKHASDWRAVCVTGAMCSALS